jgi:putative transposase
MSSTKITHLKYRRVGLRYASDLTDSEWALSEPLLSPTSPLDRPGTMDLRSVRKTILYIGSATANGGNCQESSLLT